MKKIISFLVISVPAFAYALTPVTDVNTLRDKIIGIANVVTYILVAAAVLFIVWNVVRYMISGSGEESKSKAGLNILWGIVGLFIIVSIWGLVNILTNTFATTPTNQNIPNFNTNASSGGIPGTGVPGVN